MWFTAVCGLSIPLKTEILSIAKPGLWDVKIQISMVCEFVYRDLVMVQSNVKSVKNFIILGLESSSQCDIQSICQLMRGLVNEP